MKKALMIIAIVAIVVIAGSMLYYYVFFRTGVEKTEIKLQEEKQQDLAKCLREAEQNFANNMDIAYKAYKEAWNAECKRLDLAPDSPLPNYIVEGLTEAYNRDVERIDKLFENEKADCFKFWQD